MQVEVIESRFTVHDNLGWRTLPYREIKGGESPGLFTLSGFGANHFGGRAKFLFERCLAEERNLVAFTNSGLDSPTLDSATGRHIVKNFSMERWANEAVALFKATTGPQLVVANSLSTPFAIRIAQENPDRVIGLVLVAPATKIDPTLNAWFDYAPSDRATFEEKDYFDLPVHTVKQNGHQTFVRITKLAVNAEKAREIKLDGEISIPCEVAILHDPKDPQVSRVLVDQLAACIRTPGPKRPKVVYGDNVSHVRAGQTDHEPMWDLIAPFARQSNFLKS